MECERQITDITGQGVEKALDVLVEIEYVIFIATLATLFPVDTHDRASSSDEHLFHLSESFQTKRYRTRIHVILSREKPGRSLVSLASVTCVTVRIEARSRGPGLLTHIALSLLPCTLFFVKLRHGADDKWLLM